MTEEKETQQPDELFRSIFEALPDEPGPNGWDKPSARVWSHIRRQIRPTPLSPGLKGALILAVLAVAVVAYLQWANVSEKPAASSAPAPTAQTAEQLAPAAPPTPAPPPPAAPARRRPAASATQPPQPPLAHTAQQPWAEETAKAPEMTPPRRNEDIQTPKNTAELRRLELRKLSRNAWETPLQPLPVTPKKVEH